MRRSSLTANTALMLLVCCAMLMALMVMLQGAWQDWQRGEEIIRERTLAVARFYQARQSMRTASTETMLATLAQAPSVRSGASASLDDFMQRLDVAQPDYLGFALFDTTGRALSAVAGGQNFTALPAEVIRSLTYFRSALENRAFTVGLGLSSRSQPGKMYLPMAKPVLNEDGTVRSLVFAPLDMSRFLQEDMDSGMAALMEQHAMMVRLLDREGRVLYQSTENASELGQVLQSSCYLKARAAPGNAVIQEGSCEHLGRGITVLLRTSLRPDQAHHVEVLVQAVQPSWGEFLLTHYNKSLLSIVASLVFALLVARLVGRHFFSLGLARLVEVASAMREGRTAMRCGVVDGCSEIQTLGTSMDAMLDALGHGNRQLREQRERLEMALAAADMGVWHWYADTSFLLLDTRGWETLGYKDKERDAINALTVVYQGDLENFQRALEEHQMGATSDFSQEIRLRRADGETAWMHFSGRVTGRENSRDVQGVCPDVTARRKVAELEREQMEHYRRLSTIDPLTGLWNRRYFNDAARVELLRCLRNGNAVSIIMTDIDFFKKVNDTYGHAAGDGVLRHFASVMRESVRVTDLVARYGGEEFVLMLPETEQADAAMVAEKVRAAFAARHATWEGQSITCTASFGVCAYVPQKDAYGYAGQKLADSVVEQLVAFADASLYTSKQEGRNRVTSCNAHRVNMPAESEE